MSDKAGWLSRLKQGLQRSSSRLTGGISDLFTKRKLDDAALEELEEVLITADLGVTTSAKLVQALASQRFNQEVSDEEVRTVLADEIAKVLEPVAKPLEIDGANKPHVVIMCGVNGSGKTTTIGKLARQWKDEGKSVIIAAADTFRAAAIEQLEVWGERSGCPVISSRPGADAAGLAFDALQRAQVEGADVLVIDTAGRLQNKKGLMDELAKIIRVIRKLDPSAPHANLLVMDATIGQNAHAQVKAFAEIVDLNGLVLTKLDGTAKGGVVVALAEAFGLPVHAVGVGEGINDLRPFEARAFAQALMGLEE